MGLINADRWILLSGLQKAIRRNDIEYAQRFGLSLYRIDKRAFWRRLPIIAMEDIGLGDADLMLEVCKITWGSEYRKLRSDESFALDLIDKITNAPKNHAIDHLIKIASVMPTAIDHKRDYQEQALDMALDIYTRAQALLKYSRATRVVSPDLYQPTIEAVHRAVCLPNAVYEVSQMALLKMDNDMPLLFPLLDGVAREQVWQLRHVKTTSEMVGDIPAYAFDPLHTRLGKAAIRRWKHEIPELQRFTERQIAKAVFNTESIALGIERYCDLTDQIKADGITASLIEGNLIRSRHKELFDVVNHTFPALNESRRHVQVASN